MVRKDIKWRVLSTENSAEGAALLDTKHRGHYIRGSGAHPLKGIWPDHGWRMKGAEGRWILGLLLISALGRCWFTPSSPEPSVGHTVSEPYATTLSSFNVAKHVQFMLS